VRKEQTVDVVRGHLGSKSVQAANASAVRGTWGSRPRNYNREGMAERFDVFGKESGSRLRVGVCESEGSSRCRPKISSLGSGGDLLYTLQEGLSSWPQPCGDWRTSECTKEEKVQRPTIGWQIWRTRIKKELVLNSGLGIVHGSCVLCFVCCAAVWCCAAVPVLLPGRDG
jgi:hypothetical protein